jgi:hypothetical protein
MNQKEDKIMPTKMKDDKKGGEDRVKKLEEEQQKEMEKKDVESPGEFPEVEKDIDKMDPPGGKGGHGL